MSARKRRKIELVTEDEKKVNLLNIKPLPVLRPYYVKKKERKGQDRLHCFQLCADGERDNNNNNSGSSSRSLQVYMVADGHGDTNMVVDYVMARLPVVMAKTFSSLQVHPIMISNYLHKSIIQAFSEVEKEVLSCFRNYIAGGCVLGMLIKYFNTYTFVQCGDLNLLAIKTTGETVLKMPVHDVTNQNEVLRVGSQHIVNNRLFGVLECFRVFGDFDLQGSNIHAARGKWKNVAPHVVCAKPEIRILTPEEVKETDYFCLASDGLLDMISQEPDRNFTEVYQDFYKSKLSPYAIFDGIVNLATRYTNDDISLMVIKKKQ